MCVVLAVSGCAYNTETLPTAATDTVTSYSTIVFVDATALNQVVRPSDIRCAAQTFLLDFTIGLPASVRETLLNVVAEIDDCDMRRSPAMRQDDGTARVAALLFAVRDSTRYCGWCADFWSANIVTDVTVTASVTVEGKTGRIFGKTLEGRGHGDTPEGLFRAGGSELADQVQHELVRHIGEEIGNADRIRGSQWTKHTLRSRAVNGRISTDCGRSGNRLVTACR